jgi:hypothetical protein
VRVPVTVSHSLICGVSQVPEPELGQDASGGRTPALLDASSCTRLGHLARPVGGVQGRRDPGAPPPGLGLAPAGRRAQAVLGRISAARTARSAQSSRGLGWARRSTATSCRSTSSSASLDAGERPSKTSQPPGRTKIRYSRRKDTADHHVLQLIRAHRRSSEARQAFCTPQVHPYWTGVRVRGGRDQGRVDIATGAPVLVDPGSTLCGCRTAYSPLRGPSCRRYSRSPARPCAASPRTPGAGSPLMPSIPGTRRSWR